VLPVIERHGAIRAWIVDDTGFPKKGIHSVGVARQYCGQLGKPDNCQVAVSLSLANDHASLPIAFQLYLPEEWAQNPERRAKAGVPETGAFHSKPAIALAQIRAALLAGVSPAVVLADAGYGSETAFRTALTRMGLTYIVGIASSTSLWAPGTGPLPPQHKPISAQKLAKTLPETTWQIVTWREGSKAALTSQGRADLAQGRADLALCGRTGAAGSPRLVARAPAAGGVVPDRMARGREAADQVLARGTGSRPCRRTSP
jgi:SRSO17 transposase